MYWPRIIEKTVQKVKKTFPVILITGPRQSGKSTLLQKFLGKKAKYFSLEDPQFRSLLRENPIDFLENQSSPVILDEIQNYPEITNAIKILVDRKRKPGTWFLTGSQQFSVMKNVSESMAGRVAVLTLPPFQIRERKDIHRLEDFVFRGSYPELAVNTKVDARVWYSSYLQTYLERDIRQLLHVSDLRDFEQLIRLLAASTGQELNYSSFSNRLGISVPTVKRWVSVLESSFIIFLLPPYFNNLGKRIVKAPKIYFYDVGLVNYLLGMQTPGHVLNGPMAGAIFETAVISEVLKLKYAEGIRPQLYYWRSQSGMEIDLIIEQDGGFNPYEVKLSSTVKPLFYSHLRHWLDLTKQKKQKGYLITNCKKELPLPKGIKNIYWKDL